MDKQMLRARTAEVPGTEALKACPFCGGEAQMLVGSLAYTDAIVECTLCGAQGEAFGMFDIPVTGLQDHIAEAAAAWNKRVPHP